MKTSIIIVALVGAALVAGTIIRWAVKKAPPVPPPVAEAAPETPFAGPSYADIPREEPLETGPQNPPEPAQVSITVPAASYGASTSTSNAIPHPTPFSQAIDTLVSPKASFHQKQDVWRELRNARQLDQAIEALQRGAAENPTSAAYPAALGQAQLQKCGVLAQNGAAINEIGMLGMQADQSLDQALKRDPANWEAQFFKATAMHHWPLELNKGNEVVQRLSRLIDQQETMPPQPQFAQTYVVLGDQYQKMGQPDYADATWQFGAQKFPGHQELQKKIRGN